MEYFVALGASVIEHKYRGWYMFPQRLITFPLKALFIILGKKKKRQKESDFTSSVCCCQLCLCLCEVKGWGRAHHFLMHKEECGCAAGWAGARVFSSPVTDTRCIISAGCQSLSPSPSRLLQSNVIHLVCQPLALRRHVFITLCWRRDICSCVTGDISQSE